LLVVLTTVLCYRVHSGHADSNCRIAVSPPDGNCLSPAISWDIFLWPPVNIL